MEAAIGYRWLSQRYGMRAVQPFRVESALAGSRDTARDGGFAKDVRATLEHEMRDEASFLRSLRAAREGIKRVFEGPDSDIDRIIRSVRDNSGAVSNRLRAEFPRFEDPFVAAAVVEAVVAAWAWATGRCVEYAASQLRSRCVNRGCGSQPAPSAATEPAPSNGLGCVRNGSDYGSARQGRALALPSRP
jgi:hypothetical protein